MNFEFQKGDILKDESKTYLVLKNNEESFKLFILNGFYTYEIDKINNKNYLYYDKKDEERTGHPELSCFCYNLGYDKTLIETKITNLEELKFERKFSIEDKFDFFDNLNRFHKFKIEHSYTKLKYLNKISSAFEKYDKKSNLPENFEIGQTFKDNLINTDYFSINENHLNLNDNYWTVVEVDKLTKTFYAIHLEYFTIAEFNFNGEILRLLNDIDSRFGKCSTRIPKSPLFYEYSDKKIYINKAYPLENIDKNHYFNGIRLLESFDFNEEQKESLWFNLVYRVKYFEFDNNETKNFSLRQLTDKLLEKYLGKSKYHGYYDVYDRNKNIIEPIYKNDIYSRFVFDDFKEKSIIIINQLLNLKSPKTNKNLINKDLFDLSIESYKKHYNKYFDKIIKEVPVNNSYYFKSEDSIVNFENFIEKERENKINTFENLYNQEKIYLYE